MSILLIIATPSKATHYHPDPYYWYDYHYYHDYYYDPYYRPSRRLPNIGVTVPNQDHTYQVKLGKCVAKLIEDCRKTSPNYKPYTTIFEDLPCMKDIPIMCKELLTNDVISHSGRTNKKGCHKNSKTKKTHCH